MTEENYDDSPWNSIGPDSLKHAIAESIGVPEETLEMDKSYRENGGNSFSMMSTFVRLKEQGSGISMEEFLQAETLTALHDSTSSSTFRPLSSHRKFRIKPLSEVSTEKTQNLLVECFIKKGEMKEGQKTSTEDLASILKMTWPVLLKYSFVMVDEAGEISGVTTLADEVDLAKLSYEGWHPYLREVSEYLESLTLSVQHQLPHNPERGVMLATFLMGTSVHNSPSENLRLMYLMMQEFDRLARQHGFKMSISHNVSPITQQLSDLFGCQRLVCHKPNSYVNAKGDRPFSHVPESTNVALQIKNY